MTLHEGDTIKEFRILSAIAQSGCSNVYLALVEETEQVLVVKVALPPHRRQRGKVISKDVYSDLIDREVEVLRSMHHPGIVRIFPMMSNNNSKGYTYKERLMDDPDRPWYFTMEYLTGGSLKANMQQIRKYPLEWRLELFYQILIIMEYMHEHDWAHCDLKPENIFFRIPPQQDEVPMPVLIDMGTVSDLVVLDNELVASLPYAAPETLQVIYGKRPLDEVDITPEKLDSWALGALFFELVTGERLIRAHKDTEMVSSILNHTYPNIRAVRPELPNNLDVLLSRMLSENPAERVPVSHLIEALEHYAAPPPRVSKQTTVGKRRGKGIFSR